MGDLDLMMDMLMSFWTLTPIPSYHSKKEVLKAIGISYTCSCPQFRHYHVCKHVLAMGIYEGTFEMPTRFSTQPVGQRKAPAGATLSKRTHCMIIDA